MIDAAVGVSGNVALLEIIGFEPNATDGVVHHMLLFACSEPGSTESVWPAKSAGVLFMASQGAFYPVVESGMTLEDGDIVAARCHMINIENHDIYVGPRAVDEMCNFYVMYWTDGQETLKKHTCSSGGPPTYYWKQHLKNVPE
uniref:Copper type II ascorbate-dependent monooxygenase C-terminal domain-containing protein n=1 Tax=Romanomermis culicivorax TaxID=13658 RepID=A0A915KXM6_ROMCU